MHPSVLIRAALSPFLFIFDTLFVIGLTMFVTVLNVVSWVNQTGEQYLSPLEVFVGNLKAYKNTWQWIWNGS